MSEDILVSCLNYTSLVVSNILLASIAIIQLIRFIQRIRSQYIDWIYIAWWVLYIWAYFWGLGELVSGYFTSPNSVTISILFGSIRWVFLYGFQIMNVIYPLLLISYCVQLTDLLKGKSFDSVKKRINSLELVLIWSTVGLLIIYFIWLVSITLLIRTENCFTLDDGLISKVKSEKWDNLFLIDQFVTLYFYLFINCFLLIAQLIIYIKLKRTMSTRLHYFHQKVKKSIKILFLWNVIFLIVSILFDLDYAIENKSFYSSTLEK